MLGLSPPNPSSPHGLPKPGYSNQWTVSGEKKPLLDPTLEAAKYWQRVKEQGFFPKPATGKDQHAVESLNEFTEFDQGPML